MADQKNRRPILGSGEEYINPIKKGSPSVPPKLPRTFEEARELLLPQIEKTADNINKLPKKSYLEESVVFSIKLNPKFIAKSYHPARFFEKTPISLIGSCPTKASKKGLEDETKLLFVRSHKKDISLLSKFLNEKESTLDAKFKDDICKIDTVSILNTEDRAFDFGDWNGGIAEMVLHPMENYADKALHLFTSNLKELKINSKDVKIATYGKGIHFVSAKLTKNQVNQIADFNILRSVSPMGDFDIPDLRSADTSTAPKPSSEISRSTIKVGIFDGGTNPTVPLLNNHVKEHQVSAVAANDLSRAHGTAVAGCVLYGDLSAYGAGSVVPSPNVSVESFQVLPRLNTTDPDLYEVIDHIEKIVPERKDIKVFNISLGPKRPISDQIISRFTYVLDELAYKHNVLFTVAVGNDGHKAAANRIQPPSDLVNGLGLGAFDFKRKGGSSIRGVADYSCIGHGREGCKVKPDLVGFGGGNQSPIALVGTQANTTRFAAGTSYSAPVIAGVAGELLGRCDRLTALSARVLITNSADRGDVEPSVNFGHGFLDRNVENIVSCDKNNITVIYQGSMRPTKSSKLEIPFIELDGLKGRLNVRWTIGILSPLDIDNVGEYTKACIEDTFYPNAQKFRLSRQKLGSKKFETKALDLRYDNDKKKELIAAGWKINKWPVSLSANAFKVPESVRRGQLKWDTIVDRQASIAAANFYKPHIILHAMTRNESSVPIDSVEFAVAVNINYPTYKGDLYSEISKIYTKLQPLEVKSLNQIVVRA